VFSVGANASHGLRRTNGDKRRAVLVLLKDSEWAQRSDRWIAEKCGVSNTFVAGLREAQLSTVDSSQVRLGKDGKNPPAKRAAAHHGDPRRHLDGDPHCPSPEPPGHADGRSQMRRLNDVPAERVAVS
jgi:hypothetical protein